MKNFKTQSSKRLNFPHYTILLIQVSLQSLNCGNRPVSCLWNNSCTNTDEVNKHIIVLKSCNNDDDNDSVVGDCSRRHESRQNQIFKSIFFVSHSDNSKYTQFK